MTPRYQYLTGVGVVVGSALLLALSLGRLDVAEGTLRATGLALVVQGPLGWWLVRSLGTPRFVGAWVVGMAARVALLVLAAFVLAPVFHWALEPFLLALAGVLVGLLFVEVIVVMRAGHPKVEAR